MVLGNFWKNNNEQQFCIELKPEELYLCIALKGALTILEPHPWSFPSDATDALGVCL